jgi:hypothetical protein
MVSQLGELSRWTEMRGNGSVHGATAQAELVDAVATDVAALKYGLGIFIISAANTGGLGAGYGHGGDIFGYHTANWYFPNRKATISVVVTSDADSSNDVVAAMIAPVLAATK